MPIISDVDYKSCESLRFWSEDGQRDDFEGISQDMRIGDKIYRHKPRSQPLDIGNIPQDWNKFKDEYLEEVPTIEEDDDAPAVDIDEQRAWFIRPEDTYYAETTEKVQLPEDFGVDVSSRSSWARYGIEVQDVEDSLTEQRGYEGHIPLWINNHGRPLVLRERDGICQAVPYFQERGWSVDGKLIEAYNNGGVDASIGESDFIKVSPKTPSKAFHIELTLDNILKEFTGDWIDPHKNNSDDYKEIDLRNGGLVVEEGKLYLASSKERVELDNCYAGYLDSTSRIEGLIPDAAHANAPWIQPGFEGNIIFELYSRAPSKINKGGKLQEGKNIGGFNLCALKSPCSEYYDSKYSDQEEVVTSKAHKDFL